MADDMKHVKMEVMRYNPETDDAPHFVTYDVPYEANLIIGCIGLY